ncbi:CHASE domain-containing protein [Marinobacterium rhizophilum]|uniref:CHASE domain-containing protein n=1 Tax=Marinobacterium rhizophilum TaxID=420402 RepID=UPI000379D4D3|nr:CHASE domain-containing protein [Marinobacterium rhizophilum]
MQLYLNSALKGRWSHLTLLLGLAITALATWQLDQSNTRRIGQAVQDGAEQASRAVLSRIKLYQYGLRGARGAVLTAGEHGISRELFHRYSLTRDFAREFPGARGFGFIRRVAPASEASFLQWARADGWPDFHISQLNPHNEERYVIQYIEPVRRNIQAVGLDIGSEKNRRDAALAAIRTGRVQLTGPITLVQATGKPLQSVLILMPIYRDGPTPMTIAGREKNAFGWSYAPLLMEEVLTDLGLDSKAVHLELRDVTVPGEEETFFTTQGGDNAPRLHTFTTYHEVYGRRWESRFSVSPLFVARQPHVPPLQLFLLGGLISLLGASLVGSVSASRQSRRQVLAEQARLAAIVESSANGIIGKTLDGVVTSWNRGAEDIFGYSASAAIGRTLMELVLPGRRQGEEADMLERVGRGEHIPHFETVRRRYDGSQINVSLTVSPICDSAARVVGASETVRDISSQKEAEARILELNSNLEAQVMLRTSELAQLNTLFGNVLDAASEVAIIATDEDGLIRLFNTGAERMLGYRADEVIGHCTSLRFHQPEEVESRGADLARELGRPVEGFDIFTLKPEQEGAEAREWSFVRRDGALVPVMLVMTAMRDDAGQLSGYLAIANDITAQRKHNIALTTARDQLLMAADVAQLGIWTWTLADDGLDWNDKMFELYEQPRSLQGNGLCYKHWYSRVHPDDVEATAACLAAAVNGGSPYAPIFRILLPDGRIRYIQAGAQVEYDDLGQPERVTGINLDITVQRELEARLRQAKQQADQANAAKSTFLANMSHEIRTPMNAVLGMLQLVQHTDLNERQFDYISKADVAARSLLGLLNDILDYSKIEVGKLHLEPHSFELEGMMQELAVVLSDNLGAKPVELMFDLAPSLPEHLIGDRLRLLQVFINLAGNAIKFTEKGEVVVRISELDRNETGVRLCVAITDTGIGIAADHLGHIFDGFSQAEASTARRFGGTGLGLVISKRLVGMMGGDLCVRSEPGVGSCFSFEIRLGIDAGSPRQVEPAREAEPFRILIADDNPVSSEILSRTVTALGWQAVCVSSGEDAVAHIERADYALVLMDWAMPGIDGLEAARRIRGLGRAHSPSIIMITGYGREQLAQAQQQTDAPFVDFLTKPITAQQLAAAVQRVRTGSPARPRRQAPRRQRQTRLQGMCLLVVEDNAINRQVAAQLLSIEGATVTLAEGGLEGVEKVLEAPAAFDVVLMDMQMPDIDGLEATRRIRADERCRDLPILAMTANVTQADKAACLAAGMNDHVGKPLDIDNLVALLLSHSKRAGSDGDATGDRAEVVPARPGGRVESPEAVLSRFGGDVGLLRSMLLSFEANAKELFAELEGHLRDRNTASVARLLHTFKGVAGTLGASAFASRMGELEASLKGPEADQALRRLDATAVAELKTLLDDSRTALLAAVVAQEVAQEPVLEAAPAKMPSVQRDRFAALLALLESGNLEALEVVESLPDGAAEDCAQQLQMLATEVQNLNFAEASRIVRELLESA